MSGLTTPAVRGDLASPRRDNAAARLYVEYRERIYRFCLSRLRSREEAEDAVQNVFLRVHTALDKGVVPEYEAAWLYKIAHNVCLSRIDSNARRGAEELHAFDDEDVQFAAPDVSRDELAGLNEALEAMPHNLRTAILLREWQGLSYAEIADAMGLSVSAVETLIFRARRHLANALEHGVDRRTPVARALDLLGVGALLRKLRHLLAGAAPAKLATGAALVVLGGGGTAVALTATMPTSGPAERQSIQAVQVAATALASPGGAAAAAPRATRRVVSITSTSVVAVRGLAHPVPVEAMATTTEVVVTVPATSTGGSAPGSPRSPGSPVVVGATTGGAPAPTTGSLSTVPVPTTVPVGPPGTTVVTVTVPTVTVPTTVKVPTVTVPTTVKAPTIPTPTTVPVPTVTVPTVTVPTVSTPTVTVPTVTVPTVSVPTVSTPTTITVPTVPLALVGRVDR